MEFVENRLTYDNLENELFTKLGTYLEIQDIYVSPPLPLNIEITKLEQSDKDHDYHVKISSLALVIWLV